MDGGTGVSSTCAPSGSAPTTSAVLKGESRMFDVVDGGAVFADSLGAGSTALVGVTRMIIASWEGGIQ